MINKMSITLATLLVATLHASEATKPIMIKEPIVRSEGTGSLGPWISYVYGHGEMCTTVRFFSKALIYDATRSHLSSSGGIMLLGLTPTKAHYQFFEEQWKLQQQKLSTSQNPAQKAMPKDTENTTIKK